MLGFEVASGSNYSITNRTASDTFTLFANARAALRMAGAIGAPPVVQPPMRRGQAEDNRALHLRPHRVRIHHRPAINRADDAVNPDLALLRYRDFRHVREKAPERFVQSDATSATGGHSRSPAGFLGHELKH